MENKDSWFVEGVGNVVVTSRGKKILRKISVVTEGGLHYQRLYGQDEQRTIYGCNDQYIDEVLAESGKFLRSIECNYEMRPYERKVDIFMCQTGLMSFVNGIISTSYRIVKDQYVPDAMVCTYYGKMVVNEADKKISTILLRNVTVDVYEKIDLQEDLIRISEGSKDIIFNKKNVAICKIIYDPSRPVHPTAKEALEA